MKDQINKGSYPELTIASVIFGYLIGILLTISITYASLVLSYGTCGSIIASILGFALLKVFVKRYSIVENNIIQTVASGVNNASNGIVFTLPALFFLGYTNFNPYLIIFCSMTGGILGLAFIIPLRKKMIEFDRLAFPTGIAVAAVLKTPNAKNNVVKRMLYGVVISGTVYLAAIVFQYEEINVGKLVGVPEYFNMIFLVSLMSVGVGYIAGIGGISFVIGGFLCYWFLAPIMNFQGLLPNPQELAAQNINILSFLRMEIFKPIGIGMLVGGALTGLVLSFPMMINALKSMHRASKNKSSYSTDELSIKFLYAAIITSVIVLFIIALKSASNMSITTALIMSVLSTLWIYVAGVIISECAGRTDWSPLSGMTLIAVTLLILITASKGAETAIISSVMVGIAVCVSMGQAADLMQDLKTGFMVGASPKKQQISQFISVWLGPIIVVLLIFVLHKAYVLGSDKLPAAQGSTLAAMIKGILGGNVPIQKYVSGTGLGILLSSLGVGGLGVMVGLSFYLPFNVVLTYSVGLILRIITDKKFGNKFSDEYGIPLASGLLIGEALVGVIYAIIVVGKGLF